ncbi:SMCO3 protein, partial [Atractosteus spatula]|nr:SMCO3 protein [Atractosteus spatula]
MSWSDLFFPGNPARREQIIRKTQELRDLMQNNFRATNQLIEVLKEHLGLSFSPITLNKQASIKENCDVMIQCMHEIQAEVEKINKKLKEKLEPTLYEKLRTLSPTVHDLKHISKAVSGTLSVTGFTSCIVLSWLIKNGMILKNITSTFVKVGSGCIGCVVLGVLFLGIDMITQAILGSIERDELEKALKEYEEALNEFRPASEQFQDNITYVRIKIEMIEEEKN